MKRIFTCTIVPASFALVLLLSGCAAPTKASNGASATALPPVQTAKNLSAEAKLLPKHFAALSLPAGGSIAEVLVREGDQVEPGQVIVRLNDDQQAAALAQAQAGLKRAEAQLDAAKSGPLPEEIAAAQATIDVAQAQLTRLSQGARPEDVAVAKAGLAGAQADRQKALEGADPDLLVAAQAEVANAEAAIRQAQASYDRISGNPDVGARPEALALEQATISLTGARSRYQSLQRGPTAATLAKANAGVKLAQAQLDAVQAAVRPGDVAAAEAEVRRAEAELALAKTGARPEAVKAAEADVAAAQAEVDRAQAALAGAALKAPFAGTVVTLDARPGEQIAAGQLLARLADLTAWQVETVNLTELNVARVKVGQEAALAFDAVPDLNLAGKVTAIRGLGESRQGDTVYTVVVTPDSSDPALRWNMTVQVTFGR